MIECIAAALGAPDILINNAGMQYVSPILIFPPEKWDMMLAVNLSASFHTIRLCAPAMLKKGWGRFFILASVSGLVGEIGRASGRARRCRYGRITVVAVSLKKKIQQ